MANLPSQYPKTSNEDANSSSEADASSIEPNRVDVPSASPISDLSDAFPIVGIGASAGGLDAFKKFFASIPDNCGIAFVLVPHLDPKHKSLMVELLARQTAMRVVEAAQDMKVEINCVYIIPPNHYISLRKGVLKLSSPPHPNVSQTSIDFFLRSLAEDRGERAIGIVFSGTGSHGTLGIREIKRCGGMVMAQSPESAEFDQMPLSAIGTGLVDFVLMPEEMSAILLSYVEQPYISQPRQTVQSGDEFEDHLKQILDLLKATTKFDFHFYRPNMLLRRIERRMGLAQINDIAKYLGTLQSNPDEATALCNDFLIGVTAFFREPEAYGVLEQEIIPKLVTRQSRDVPIRIWIPSCATGEEAYSLAILMFEAFAAADKPVRMQIFASDINQQSIEVARRGIFPSSIASDISPERLRRFFLSPDPIHYKIDKSLRESIVFSRQNLITDAPFSNLDLISCRNLLIYLLPEMQQKLIELFHFALVEKGFLFLGPSETVGRSAHIFSPISKKWRVFSRIGSSRPNRIDVPLAVVGKSENGINVHDAMPIKQMKVKELTEQIIMREYAPAAAMINRKYEVLYVTGPLADYLEYPTGELSKDLLTMARPGLRTKIRAACLKSIQDQSPATSSDARVKRGSAYYPCTITVRPVSSGNVSDGLMLVAFHDRPHAKLAPVSTPDDSIGMELGESDDATLVHQLEFDLNSARESLLSSVEEMESSNEELKASNEEIMSMNEELQSSNEELESSKEELQSLNEELSTVNSELLEKISELDASNSDMMNLMISTEIATVFLDSQLLIKRFTPPTVQLLSLVPSDVGRPLRDFAPRFTDSNMLNECRQVLLHHIPIETEIDTEDHRFFLRRILPYRTTDKLVDGVVITFVDLTQRKQMAAARHKGETRFRNVFLNAATGIAITRLDGLYEQCNPAYCELLGYSEVELQQKNFRELIYNEDLTSNLDNVNRLRSGELHSFENESRYVHKNGQCVWVRKFVSVIPDEEGNQTHLVALVTDMTELRRAHASLYESSERMKAILNTASDAIITFNKNGEIESVNLASEKMFGYSRNDLIGKNVEVLIPCPSIKHTDGFFDNYLRTIKDPIRKTQQELVCRRHDETTFLADIAVSQVDHLGLYTIILRDISYRKQMQEHILEIAASEQQRIGQELHDGIQQELTGLSLFTSTLLQSICTAQQKENAWEFKDVHFNQLKNVADILSKRLGEANQHVRELAHGIMPVQIDAQGLRSALGDLATTTDSHENLSCRFECSDSIEIGNNLVASHLYRIAQEAISNALRHGAADQIVISLSQQRDKLCLEVTDNGEGFDPSNVLPQLDGQAKGMGLRTMAYRANLIGGDLQFKRGASGGITVKCTVSNKRSENA